VQQQSQLRVFSCWFLARCVPLVERDDFQKLLRELVP
jgi:hypothetical protein